MNRARAPRTIARHSREDIVLLDFGSTAVRLAFARVRRGIGYRILAEARLPTRLTGRGLRRLRPAAIRRALASADRFIRAAGEGRAPPPARHRDGGRARGG